MCVCVCVCMCMYQCMCQYVCVCGYIKLTLFMLFFEYSSFAEQSFTETTLSEMAFSFLNVQDPEIQNEVKTLLEKYDR